MSLCIVQSDKENLYLPLFYDKGPGRAADGRPPHPPSPYCRYMGKSNMIISYSGKESHFQTHRGMLSIKCAFRGQEHYSSDSGSFSVDGSRFLVINEGQRYSSSVSSEKEVESFCLFLSRNLKEDVLKTLILPGEKLLADPDCLAGREVVFVERTYRYDSEIGRILLSLKESVDTGRLSHAGMDEGFHLLLEHLLRRNSFTQREIDTVPLVRRSARLEMYRRLLIAKDYIDSSLREKLTIKDMAAAACLSPHHFLRLFRSSFAMTPHQYIISRRLDRAREMLELSDLPVTEIALEAGFESLSHFSRLFSSHFGISAREFRKKKDTRPAGFPADGPDVS